MAQNLVSENHHLCVSMNTKYCRSVRTPLYNFPNLQEWEQSFVENGLKALTKGYPKTRLSTQTFVPTLGGMGESMKWFPPTPPLTVVA